MNKAELINAIVEGGVAKKEAELALNAVVKAITDALVAGEKVQLAGFGTFEVKESGERTGINLHTKEKIIIPASKAPKFKPAKALKDAMNQ